MEVPHEASGNSQSGLEDLTQGWRGDGGFLLSHPVNTKAVLPKRKNVDEKMSCKHH